MPFECGDPTPPPTPQDCPDLTFDPEGGEPYVLNVPFEFMKYVAIIPYLKDITGDETELDINQSGWIILKIGIGISAVDCFQEVTIHGIIPDQEGQILILTNPPDSGVMVLLPHESASAGAAEYRFSFLNNSDQYLVPGDTLLLGYIPEAEVSPDPTNSRWKLLAKAESGKAIPTVAVSMATTTIATEGEFIALTASGTSVILGLEDPKPGKSVYLYNSSDYDITLKHEDATPNNREKLFNPTEADFTLASKDVVLYVWPSCDFNRWMLVMRCCGAGNTGVDGITVDGDNIIIGTGKTLVIPYGAYLDVYGQIKVLNDGEIVAEDGGKIKIAPTGSLEQLYGSCLYLYGCTKYYATSTIEHKDGSTVTKKAGSGTYYEDDALLEMSGDLDITSTAIVTIDSGADVTFSNTPIFAGGFDLSNATLSTIKGLVILRSTTNGGPGQLYGDTETSGDPTAEFAPPATNSTTPTGTPTKTGLFIVADADNDGAATFWGSVGQSSAADWEQFVTSGYAGDLDSNARVGVRKNSTGSTHERRRLNLIEGTGVSITIADDSGNEEVDVTLASSGVFAGASVYGQWDYWPDGTGGGPGGADGPGKIIFNIEASGDPTCVFAMPITASSSPASAPPTLGTIACFNGTFYYGAGTSTAADWKQVVLSNYSGDLDSNARVGVRKNSTGSTHERRRLNLIEGSNVTITIADDSGDEEVDITIASSGGAGVSDGDKGDITVSSSGTVWTIDNSAVSLGKIANIADQTILGNNTGGAAAPVALSAANTKTVLSLNNVENTALSTWAGTTNIVTLGTVTTGVWSGTAILVTKGGTGLTSCVQGDLLYGSAADTISKLAKDANATRYLSNTGASNNPAWAQIDLSNGVTGDLPLADGGTGASLADPGADRIMFWDDSAGAVTWLELGSGLSITTTTISATTTVSDGDKGDITVSSSGTVWTIDNSAVSLGKIANIADQTILGNNTGGAAAPVALSAANTKTVLSLNNVENTALSTWAGTTNIVTLGTVTTGVWSGTAVLVTKGGTGLTSCAQGDLLYGSAADTLSKLAKDANATRYLSNTGSSNNPAWAQIDLSNGVTGDLPLADGGTGASLSDPNADRILFWDDSAGAVTWLEVGSGLAITTTTLSVTSSISDGDKGDITVSSSGTVWTIDNGAVALTNIEDTAAQTILGNNLGISGPPKELTATQTKTVLSLDNVENTALSTWAGTTNVVTLGTVTTGVWSGTAVLVTKGGTGLTSCAQGDLLYGSAADTLSKLAKDANATRYLSNTGASNNPAWAQIDLSNGVTGDLPLADGGTGASLSDPKADRILFWDDSAGAVTWLEVGSGLNITTTTLTATGGVSDGDKGDITVSSSGTVWTIDNSAVSLGKIANIADQTILGNNTGGAAAPVALSAANTKTVLSLNNVENTALSTWAGTTNIVTLGTVTTGVWSGTEVGVTKGGTGLTSCGQGDLFYGSAANTVAKLAKDANATRYLSNTGASNNPAWAQIDLSNGVTGDLPLADGGTGASLSDPNADRIMFWDDSAGAVTWLEVGSGLNITTTTLTATGGVSDGDKGDITVSSSGTVWTIDNDAVTYAKIQNVSATDRVLGRKSGGAGDIEEIACTSAGRDLIDDANAAAQRTTLGLVTIASSGSASDLSSGTVPTARLGSGTANSTTFLRGDQTWDTPTASIDITGMTAAEIALADAFPTYNASAAANRKITTEKLGGFINPALTQGRLTLTTGVPVTTSAVTAASTVYFTPLAGELGGGNRVCIYDGTRWNEHILSEVSQALSDSTKSPAAAATNSAYWMLLWNDSGTVRCTRSVAWTSLTNPGTGAGTAEVTTQDGVLVNAVSITNGPAANRGKVVGLIITDGSTQLNVSTSRIDVANIYNRVWYAVYCQEGTNTWTYTTATWREANGGSTIGTTRVAVALPLNSSPMRAMALGFALNNLNPVVSVGVGIDSTTTNSAPVRGFRGGSSIGTSVHATYVGMPGRGGRVISWLEISAATGTTTWWGDNASTTPQAGMLVEVLA